MTELIDLFVLCLLILFSDKSLGGESQDSGDTWSAIESTPNGT